MSGSGREALPHFRVWSGVHPGCPGVVERPPDVRSLSRGPPVCPDVVGSPSRMSGSGRETLKDVRE